MATAVMETICTGCKNRDICKFVTDAAALSGRIYEFTQKTEGTPLRVRLTCGKLESEKPFIPTNLCGATAMVDG